MTFEQFKDILLEKSKNLNLTDFYIYHNKTESQSMSCYKSQIKNYSANISQVCYFKCIIDNKSGSSSTTFFNESEALRLVETAINNSGFLQPDFSEFLHADTDHIYNFEPYTLSTYDDISDLLVRAEFEALSYSKKISKISNCSFKETISKISIINSNGINKTRSYSNKFLYVSSTATENGETYNNFNYSWGKSLNDLNYKKTARISSINTIKTISPQPIKTQKYITVLKNNVVCDLLQAFNVVFSSENAYKGISLFKDKEGSNVASSLISIIDSGGLKDASFNCPFDDEGVKTISKYIIKNGTLNTLLYNNRMSHKLNKKSTGNGFKDSPTSNISISPCVFYIKKGITTKKQMFQNIETGIFITSLKGLHSGTNPNTGDFSLEASGFYIENGEISYPINNFILSDNFYDILKKVQSVGNDLYFDLPSINNQYGSPSLAVNDMYIAN
ncbi:MAG: TldD/PmbA family protein [Oscillospiraceae bacterium]